MKRRERKLYLNKSHPFYSMSSKGRISEARLIMAEQLGRPLTKKEIVHHIDNDAMNNSLDNLIVMSYDEHFWVTRRNTIKIALYKIGQDKKQLEKELGVVNKRITGLGLT